MAVVFSKFVGLVPWVGVPLACWYLRSSIHSHWLRGALATTMGGVLIGWTSAGLRPGRFDDILLLSLSWMVSIRLVNLMMLLDAERAAMTLRNFASKFVWFFAPIIPKHSADLAQLPVSTILHRTISLCAISATKFVLMHWSYGKLLQALTTEPLNGSHYWTMVRLSPILYLFFLSGTYTDDLRIAIVEGLSRGRYSMLPMNDWPVLSFSLREAWGRRYNLLVSTLLRESVFAPLKSQAGLSNVAAGLMTFGVSAALHAHVARVAFEADAPSLLKAALFFLLHGFGCVLEPVFFGVKKNRTEEEHIAGSFLSRFMKDGVSKLWVAGFFILTAPLYPAFFADKEFLLHNPPPYQSFVLRYIPFILPCDSLPTAL